MTPTHVDTTFNFGTPYYSEGPIILYTHPAPTAPTHFQYNPVRYLELPNTHENILRYVNVTEMSSKMTCYAKFVICTKGVLP